MCPWGSSPHVTLLYFRELRQRPLCQARAISCDFRYGEQIVNNSLIFSPMCLCLVPFSESVVCSAVVLGRRMTTAARRRNPIWQVDHLVGMAGTERAGSRTGTQLVLAKLSHDIFFFFPSFFFFWENILTISSTSWPWGDIEVEKITADDRQKDQNTYQG